MSPQGDENSPHATRGACAPGTAVPGGGRLEHREVSSFPEVAQPANDHARVHTQPLPSLLRVAGGAAGNLSVNIRLQEEEQMTRGRLSGHTSLRCNSKFPGVRHQQERK